MRAIQYSRYGGPDVLREVQIPDPVLGAGDVQVSVLAASIGGGEVPIRAGRLRRVLRQRLPAGTGVDFAGRVAAVGAGVSRVAVGDPVWGLVPHGTFGAIAEHVVVPEERVALAPANVSPVEAAALAAAGTTAVHALTQRVQLGSGQRLLVRGATGGVGTVAVQLGVAVGAHVTALVGADSLDWISDLGADVAYDYRRTTARQLPRFDVIIDLVGTEIGGFRRRLDHGGTMLALALDPAHPVRTVVQVAAGAIDRRTRLTMFSNDPDHADMGRLAQLVDRKVITPVVHAVLPMHDTAEAHKLLESGGVRGKIVVTP